MEGRHDREIEALRFGPFLLDVGQKSLLSNGQKIFLGSRAMDLLILLVQRAGAIVSKDELVACAWPNLHVEDSNLRVHIAAIRKALGDDARLTGYISNVSGRGYRFDALVTPANQSGRAPAATRRSPPPPLTRVVGRDEEIAALTDQLETERMITIVGPGGVGKSTVALAAAERLAQAGRETCYVDLSSVEQPALVQAALATALGVSAGSDDTPGDIASFLSASTALVLLDGCEQVVVAAAELVEILLRAAPSVLILATSREPLFARGEQIYQLAGLEVPAAANNLDAEAALAYSAIALFVERAANSLATFEFTDADVETVVEICRRLDGLPLAIELAAGRISVLGLRGLQGALDDRLLLLAQGRRTAQPRQQSLQATLDWSYAALSEPERAMCRRLSVFRGPFTLEAGVAVAAGDDIDAYEAVDALISLAQKSLLNTDHGDGSVLYRTLNVTRAYAASKLTGPDNLGAIRRRHAQQCQLLLGESAADWETLTRRQWLSKYGYALDDVRAALDWAFSPEGDIDIAASLTVAAMPFGFQLCLIDEFRHRVETALERLSGAEDTNPVPALRLAVALCNLLQNMSGGEDDIDQAFEHAEALAETIGDIRFRIEPLVTRATFEIDQGRYAEAVATTDKLLSLAETSTDPLALLIAERAASQSLHFAGEHRRAEQVAERVINHPAASIPLVYSQTSVDRRVSMRVITARILWLEGLADTAWDVAQEGLELASVDGPFAVCQTLALSACPIALWRGDFESAGAMINQLLEQSRRFSLDRWRTLGLCYQNALVLHGAWQHLGPSPLPYLAELKGVSPLHNHLLATVLPERIHVDTGVAADRLGWCGPEILRRQGESALQKGASASAEQAALCFEAAIGQARAQGALSWELRSATSLARMMYNRAQRAQAREILEPVLGRFTQGLEARDVKLARQLLANLQVETA